MLNDNEINNYLDYSVFIFTRYGTRLSGVWNQKIGKLFYASIKSEPISSEPYTAKFGSEIFTYTLLQGRDQ